MNPGNTISASARETVFSEIVAQWKDMVYNTVLSIVQDATEAEDLTQDVFMQVYESWDSFRKESRMSTWIYRIAIRKALDASRKKQRQKRGGLLKRLFDGTVQEEAAHFEHPGVILDKKENAAELFKAISELPEKQKTAFVLHKIEGLPYQDVAEVMEVSVMSVESLLVRAKNNLKQSLEAYYTLYFKQ